MFLHNNTKLKHLVILYYCNIDNNYFSVSAGMESDEKDEIVMHEQLYDQGELNCFFWGGGRGALDIRLFLYKSRESVKGNI